MEMRWFCMKKLKKPVRVITTVYSCYSNESATTNTVITVGVTVGASVAAAVITMNNTDNL